MGVSVKECPSGFGVGWGVAPCSPMQRDRDEVARGKLDSAQYFTAPAVGSPAGTLMRTQSHASSLVLSLSECSMDAAGGACGFAALYENSYTMAPRFRSQHSQGSKEDTLLSTMSTMCSPCAGSVMSVDERAVLSMEVDTFTTKPLRLPLAPSRPVGSPVPSSEARRRRPLSAAAGRAVALAPPVVPADRAALRPTSTPPLAGGNPVKVGPIRLSLATLPDVGALQAELLVMSRALTTAGAGVDSCPFQRRGLRLVQAMSMSFVAGRGAAFAMVTDSLAIGPVTGYPLLRSATKKPVRLITLLDAPKVDIFSKRLGDRGCAHMHADVRDGPNGLLAHHLGRIVSFFVEGCARRELTYIQCETGKNRSECVAVAILMLCYGMRLAEAVALVQLQRTCDVLDNDRFKWELVCLADLIERDAERETRKG